jgi:hypothetical protein
MKRAQRADEVAALFRTGRAQLSAGDGHLSN